jgi:GNAT superfamily N-acetyltransferase
VFPKAGRYAPPSGCLLLATVDGEPAGCVALKRLADGVAEMRRLYVRGQYQGAGLGRTLAEQVVREARRLSYQAVRLHTLSAVNCPNPVAGAVFLELRLEERDGLTGGEHEAG